MPKLPKPLRVPLYAPLPTALQEAEIQPFLALIEQMGDLLFWVKNLHGQFVHASQSFIDHAGLGSVAQLLGQNDYDLAPRHLAEHYIKDDQRVLAGEPIRNRQEILPLPSGEIGWFSTTKEPLRDRAGEIIGSIGFSRRLHDNAPSSDSYKALKQSVAIIRNSFSRDISLQELADASCLSVSALERRFRKYLNQTPTQFIHEVRLRHARHLLLHTSCNIAEIGAQCGLPDHSYFCKLFRRRFSTSPRAMRDAQQPPSG